MNSILDSYHACGFETIINEKNEVAIFAASTYIIDIGLLIDASLFCIYFIPYLNMRLYPEKCGNVVQFSWPLIHFMRIYVYQGFGWFLRDKQNLDSQRQDLDWSGSHSNSKPPQPVLVG